MLKFTVARAEMTTQGHLRSWLVVPTKTLGTSLQQWSTVGLRLSYINVAYKICSYIPLIITNFTDITSTLPAQESKPQKIS